MRRGPIATNNYYQAARVTWNASRQTGRQTPTSPQPEGIRRREIDYLLGFNGPAAARYVTQPFVLKFDLHKRCRLVIPAAILLSTGELVFRIFLGIRGIRFHLPRRRARASHQDASALSSCQGRTVSRSGVPTIQTIPPTDSKWRLIVTASSKFIPNAKIAVHSNFTVSP